MNIQFGRFMQLYLGNKLKKMVWKNVIVSLMVFVNILILFVSYSVADPVNIDMVKKASETFLSNQLTTSLQKPALSSTVSNVKLIESDDKNILAYIIELEPEGFMILSGDTNIRPVVSYSFSGSFPYEESEENVLLHMVKWDMEARLKNLEAGGSDIEILADLNNILWEEYISGNIVYKKLDIEAVTYGPIIKTNWDQNSPYNDKCPVDPTGDRSVVGCVATATAQIVNYWKFPTFMYFSNEDSYTSKGKNGNIRIPEDLGLSFSNLNSSLDIINYSGNNSELAYLCLGVGIKLEMSYSSDGSGAYVNSSIFNKLGYGSALEGSWPQTYTKVIDNIKEDMPVQISIWRVNLDGEWFGHSIIVDGYDESDDFFHVNMGWSGTSEDTWYNFPDIGNYHVIEDVVYDIYPYQAWAQVGGGSTNQNIVPYDFPESAPEIKWELTVPNTIPDFSDYGFKDIIVGTGDKLYASISSKEINQNDPPYICIINSYGYIEKLIKISDSEERINYLSQNSKGEIYFSPETDDIYRLNIHNDSVDKIFSSGSSYGIEGPIKIDENGNLQFFDWDIPYKVYFISSEGNLLWSHTLPDDASPLRCVSAIDDVRNRSYISYNIDEKKYLVCLNKINGSVQWQKEFETTERFGGIGPILIGKDGTVFIGCDTIMYAISYINGNTIWEKDFYPAYVYFMPTINYEGNTLYVKNGKIISEIWNPGFISALNISTGSIKWEFEIVPSLSGDGQDYMGDIMYSSKNDMVMYTYKSGENFYLAGLEDKGSYANNLWNVNYGGKITMGSGEIYLIPPTIEASIVALSTGERGNPDELGGGYENNRIPAQSSNPTPINQKVGLQTDLTLSWSCSDPDGHSLKYDVYLGDVTELMIKRAEGITQKNYTPEGLQAGKTYIWKIIASDGQAKTEGPTWSFTTGEEVFVEDILPREFALTQNYPNPFNPTTSISYVIPKSSFVNLSIYNIIGQEVKTLVNKYLQPGRYSVIWNGRDNNGNTVTSGIYLYKINAGEFENTKKLLLIK